MADKKEAKVKDLTVGNPAKLILLFALPMMAGNMFQQLYTVVDTMIVGQGVGVKALAALGAADWSVWMYYGLAMGLTQGFAIIFAREFGAKDEKGLRLAVGNSAVITLLFALVFECFGQVIAGPLLRLLKTPEEVLPGALLYLRIILGGLPLSLFYNFTASLLRSLGNSRTPLLAMIVSTVLNILLDLLFVMVFRWGIGGAAAATIISQAAAGAVCMRDLRKIPMLKLGKEDLRLDGKRAFQLIRMGLPLSFQNTIISIGGMILQSVINLRGMIFVAGFTATNKMYGLLETCAVSYGYAITTYVAQNLGAGESGRIRKGMKVSFLMAMGTSLLISILMLVFGKYILMLFIERDSADVSAVLAVSRRYLNIMSIWLFVLYILYVFRSGLQGLGDTVMPMVSGIIEFFMRTGAALLLPLLIGDSGIFYAEVLAWGGAAVFLFAMYMVRSRKILRFRTGKERI